MMFHIYLSCTSAFFKNNFSVTSLRYLRNQSKRVSAVKTLKEFKVKPYGDEDDDYSNIDMQEMFQRVKENDLDIEETFTKGEHLDTVLADSKSLYAKTLSEDREKRSFVKKKLIGRKYFKIEKETNLLTHAAKEQIRYLHKLNPYDWTPETLSKSFPISTEGVKKLIKSNFVLKDFEKIKVHDEDVKRKWESLMSGEPLDSVFDLTRRLWNEGKLIKENYNGNPNLPQAISSTLKKDSIILRKKTNGEYSAIIQKYLEYKKERKCEEKNNTELIVSSGTELKTNELSDESKRANEALKFLKKSKIFKEDGGMASSIKKDFNGAEVPFTQFKENLKNELKCESKKSKMAKQYHQWIEFKSEEKDSKNAAVFSEPQLLSKIPKYKKDNFEIKKDKTNGRNSYYLYDNETGYQHPIGLAIKGKVKVPASKNKTSSVKKINQCVYDDDGEFLFKLPS